MKHAKPEPVEPASTPVAEPEVPDAILAATLSPAEIENLKTKATKADENWNLYLRAVADLENYKKRAARERQDALRFANESLIAKLIPVLDNFEMAQAAAQTSAGDSVQSLQAGVAMILQQLKAALTEAGLEDVDATGKPFDPNLHEAVSQLETNDVPEGQVTQQLRKGYKLRERLLRPATVIVAKKPAA